MDSLRVNLAWGAPSQSVLAACCSPVCHLSLHTSVKIQYIRTIEKQLYLNDQFLQYTEGDNKI